MEAADGPARDGDEGKRKEASGKDRAGAVDETGKSGHLQRGPDGDDSDDQDGDGAQFHKGAQVIARGQQQPNRHGRSGKAIDDDEQGQRGSGEGEEMGGSGSL